MAVIFIRTTVIFIFLVIVMRLMGKRQIGEMQPFEFVITLIIADLACVPMADVSIPLVYGIVAVLTLFLLHQLLSVIERSGGKAKLILSGKPSIVINKDGVNVLELKKNNMGVDDLIESMRAMGYFSLDDLDYAIFESSGKLSALEKQKEENKSSQSIPVLIVSEGKLVKENIEYISSKESDITAFLSKNGTTLKRTEVMTIDGTGKVYLKEKFSKYRILSFPIKEGASW